MVRGPCRTSVSSRCADGCRTLKVVGALLKRNTLATSTPSIPEVCRVSSSSVHRHFVLREARAADLEAILALNCEWERVTSPLTLDALSRLHSLAAVHLVAVEGDSVLGFLLAIGPAIDYDSPNYRWFDDAGDDFLYIDRAVVSSAVQRSGVGAALYAEVFDCARQRGVSRVVCEVDIEPLNAASDAFHRRRGFVEVGTQSVAAGSKVVSLRECALR